MSYIQGETFASHTLDDAAAVEVQMRACSLPATVWVSPDVGTTVTVTYKVAPGAPAQAWPPGPVSEYQEWILNGPLHSITFQRTAGSGEVQVGVQL